MPPGLPAAVALLREEVRALDSAIDGESVKRAANVERLDGEIALLWQRLKWVEKRVDELLAGFRK